MNLKFRKKEGDHVNITYINKKMYQKGKIIIKRMIILILRHMIKKVQKLIIKLMR